MKEFILKELKKNILKDHKKIKIINFYSVTDVLLSLKNVTVDKSRINVKTPYLKAEILIPFAKNINEFYNLKSKFVFMELIYKK